MESTVVTFPAGSVHGVSEVVRVDPVDDHRLVIITSATPFHPLDHTWPDQPADRGTLAGAPVLDCLTAAIDSAGQLFVGSDIPARRGDPGWAWVVAHVVADDVISQPGQHVALEVDADYRSALSRAHTACHLAALALNAEAQPLWHKPVDRLDSRGMPDLDALAISASRIGPDRSTDDYRLGKSIRKRGLDSAELLADLPGLAARVTARTRQWVATGAAVAVDTGGDATIAARRTWRCSLPDGVAEYPCGGTHVDSLADLALGVEVVYTPTDEGFRAVTRSSAV